MTKGGWVYIMADRYRGGLYVGVTADLVRRVQQHLEMSLRRVGAAQTYWFGALTTPREAGKSAFSIFAATPTLRPARLGTLYRIALPST